MNSFSIIFYFGLVVANRLTIYNLHHYYYCVQFFNKSSCNKEFYLLIYISFLWPLMGKKESFTSVLFVPHLPKCLVYSHSSNY